MTTILLVTDADWVFEEVDMALSGPDTSVCRVRRGSDVLAATRQLAPDLVLADFQVGNMGAMAVCMELRNEEGAGRLDVTPVLMLLDRAADVFLAERSDADSWLIKPLDAFRLRRAVKATIEGKSYQERWDEHTDLRAVAVLDA